MLLITVHSDINVYVIQAHQHSDDSEEALARQKILVSPSLNTGNSAYIHCMLFQVNSARGCIQNLPRSEKGVKWVSKGMLRLLAKQKIFKANDCIDNIV